MYLAFSPVASQLPVRLRDTAGEKGGILTKNREDKKTVQSNTFNPFPLYRNNRYRGSARRAKGLK